MKTHDPSSRLSLSRLRLPFPALNVLTVFNVLMAFNVLMFSASASAQAPASNQPAKDPDAQIVTTGSTAPATSDPDDQPAPTHNANATPAQRLDEAWTMLNTALTDQKHADLRIQALAALGTMGTNPMAAKKIAAAMDDKEIDVRTAAILAAGQTKNRNLTTDLRTMLDDKEPQVAFAAAITLWKMGDRSGEDILMAVVDGDRSANPTMVNGTRHSISRSLRHPGELARFGAMQGAAMLLGPFGFGISAYEYMRKNGGDTSRVTAIEQLAEQRSGPIRKSLVEALDDKDLAVRAAAAKALGGYHDRSVSGDLFKLFVDPKPPVRLTAAAAYINSTASAAATKKTPAKT